MNPKSSTVLALAVLCAAASSQQPTPIPQPSPPQLGRPTPTVRASATRIRVQIEDGVASTTLVQTLRNDGAGIAEADWILPLPADAVADGFKMTVAGQEMPSEVLGAEQARRIYEEIVRRRRDPGLLEFAGQGMLRARVFPIPASGSVEVELRWRQILPQTASMHRWTFPLRALGLGPIPCEQISVDLRIESRVPLKNVWSPLPGVEVIRSDDHHATVGFEFEGGKLPARDLDVFYSRSEQDFGLDLLTTRRESADGHLLLMVTPKHDWPDADHTARVVQFVIDTSGSMQGAKIEQARNALRFFVDSLRPGDRFNVIPFATEAQPFFDAPRPATPENRSAAHARIDAIAARGGTNIGDALGAALGQAAPEAGEHGVAQFVPITVFLTDGLPTVGTTDTGSLLQSCREANRLGARIFVFGVGADVNTQLLDKLAADSRGDRDYVREDEDIEVKTGALLDKLSHPVLTDVEIVVDGMQLSAVEPQRLPDLFKGSRLIVLGRYQGSGSHAIRLRGKFDGVPREFVFEGDFPAVSPGHDFVAALWAQRRIASLLDAIRLNGADAELVAEVQRLGREYAIVTPYTSHLIVEEGMELADARGFRPPAPGRFFGDGAALPRLREALGRGGAVGEAEVAAAADRAGSAGDDAKASRQRLRELDRAPVAGAAAVDRSMDLARMQKAESFGGGGGPIDMLMRRLGGRSFVLVGGVWVDTAYEPSMRGSERRIVAFSDAWFDLLRQHDDLRVPFAFSTRIVVVVDRTAIEIVPPAD